MFQSAVFERNRVAQEIRQNNFKISCNNIVIGTITMNPQVSTVMCEDLSPMLTGIIQYEETQ
jgi:hypothetical protein